MPATEINGLRIGTPVRLKNPPEGCSDLATIAGPATEHFGLKLSDGRTYNADINDFTVIQNTESHFGGCPECGDLTMMRDVGRNHFACCDQHKTYWWVGRNLFSTWHAQTEQQAQAHTRLLDTYREVKPLPQESEMAAAEHRPINVELTITNTLTRWPCSVCSGCTEKVQVLAEAGTTGIRVCETCLEAGNIDERLERHAKSLEEGAAKTRALIGRLRVPTFAQWRNYSERVEVADYARYCMGNAHGDFSDVATSIFDLVLTDDPLFAKWRASYVEDRESKATSSPAGQCDLSDLPF
jgi:hypothetical protein